MSNVGFVSDLHLDINKITDEVAEMTLQTVIQQQNLDMLILVGDTYNNFERTQALVARLNTVGAAQVFFLAGNHDMARGVDEHSIEESHPYYLHKQWIDLPDSNIRIIGHNGWYDYTLAPHVKAEEAWAFHKGLYFDRVIPQTETDIARTDRALVEIEGLFAKAALDTKEVVFATHFVPINDDVYSGDDERIQLVSAIMGSKRIGDFLKTQDNLVKAVFGHQHINPPIRYYGDIPYVNVALGVNKRRHEWLKSGLLEAIEEKMNIFSK